LTGDRAGTPYAINGLQVCQRSSNDLLKGLRTYNAWLDLRDTPVSTEPHLKTVVDNLTAEDAAAGRTPEAIEVPNELEFERPNCNEWVAQRFCPEGQVGIGLDVHYNVASSGRAQITGLALHCAELTR
ncbi:MAG: hypothetical protein AAFQ43_09935, partial [Bacteroidota bacterium]